MNAVSLFAGIGGFDLGLERAGFRVGLQVERDPSCLQVLARHWADCRRIEDVRAVRPDDVAGVRLVAGGSPCQGLSVAGRGAGMDDERSGLFVELVRIADGLGDQGWVLWENVTGALSTNRGRDWSVVLEGFTGQRFDPPAGGKWRNSGFAVGPLRWCVWRVLDAQHFGVPQRRRRVFVVAGPRDRPRPGVLLEPSCLRRDPAPSRGEGEVFACLTSGGSGGCRGAQDVIAPLSTNATGGRDSLPTQLVVDLAQITSRTNRTNPRPGDPAPTLSTDPRVISFNAQQDPDSASVALPLRCQSDVAVLAGRPRKLTPLERERLQGFPEDWTAGHSATARARMTGNAVAVPVVEWIAHRLMEAMR